MCISLLLIFGTPIPGGEKARNGTSYSRGKKKHRYRARFVHHLGVMRIAPTFLGILLRANRETWRGLGFGSRYSGALSERAFFKDKFTFMRGNICPEKPRIPPQGQGWAKAIRNNPSHVHFGPLGKVVSWGKSDTA